MATGPFRVARGARRSACARAALLGWGAEEKPERGPGIAGQHRVNRRIPGVGEQGRSVLCRDVPRACSTDNADVFQPIETSEHGVGTLKAPDHHRQPAGYEPGCEAAFRIHPIRQAAGTPEPDLAGLPAPEPQEQGSDHRTGGVLMVGDELNGKKRKGFAETPTQGPGNRDELFSVLGKQVNGVSLVRGDLPVAVGSSTDRANGTDERGNIDFSGIECVLVFPNGPEGVMVGKLNLSAPCPQGSTFGCHTEMVLPCGAWSDDQGQFLTSLICLPSYHRSKDSGNRLPQTSPTALEITTVPRQARPRSCAAWSGPSPPDRTSGASS